MKTAVIALIGFSALTGCATEPVAFDWDGMTWGSGVEDPVAVHADLERLVGHYAPREGVYLDLSEREASRVGEALSAMTWEQAASVYRKASPGVRHLMCHPLLRGEQARFKGLTRPEVAALIGKPDDAWLAEHGDEWVYTGEGYVADSMSGYLFNFDAEGRCRYITIAN